MADESGTAGQLETEAGDPVAAAVGMPSAPEAGAPAEEEPAPAEVVADTAMDPASVEATDDATHAPGAQEDGGTGDANELPPVVAQGEGEANGKEEDTANEATEAAAEAPPKAEAQAGEADQVGESLLPPTCIYLDLAKEASQLYLAWEDADGLQQVHRLGEALRPLGALLPPSDDSIASDELLALRSEFSRELQAAATVLPAAYKQSREIVNVFIGFGSWSSATKADDLEGLSAIWDDLKSHLEKDWSIVKLETLKLSNEEAALFRWTAAKQLAKSEVLAPSLQCFMDLQSDEVMLFTDSMHRVVELPMQGGQEAGEAGPEELATWGGQAAEKMAESFGTSTAPLAWQEAASGSDFPVTVLTTVGACWGALCAELSISSSSSWQTRPFQELRQALQTGSQKAGLSASDRAGLLRLDMSLKALYRQFLSEAPSPSEAQTDAEAEAPEAHALLKRTSVCLVHGAMAEENPKLGSPWLCGHFGDLVEAAKAEAEAAAAELSIKAAKEKAAAAAAAAADSSSSKDNNNNDNADNPDDNNNNNNNDGNNDGNNGGHLTAPDDVGGGAEGLGEDGGQDQPDSARLANAKLGPRKVADPSSPKVSPRELPAGGSAPGTVVYVVAPMVRSTGTGSTALSDAEFQALQSVSLRSDATIVASASCAGRLSDSDRGRAEAVALVRSLGEFATQRFGSAGASFENLFDSIDVLGSGQLNWEELETGLSILGLSQDVPDTTKAISVGLKQPISRAKFAEVLRAACEFPDFFVACARGAAHPEEEPLPWPPIRLDVSFPPDLDVETEVLSEVWAAKIHEATSLTSKTPTRGAGHGVILVLSTRSRSLLQPDEYERQMKGELAALEEALPTSWPLLWAPGPAELGLLPQTSKRASFSMPRNKASDSASLLSWIRYLLTARPAAPKAN